MDSVQLIEVAKAHVPQIMTWFPTEHSCRVWGGPEFYYMIFSGA